MLASGPEKISPKWGAVSDQYCSDFQSRLRCQLAPDVLLNAPLVIDQAGEPVASDIIPTSLVGLRGGGGWPPPLSVVLTVTITHNKGVFRPIFVLTAAKRIRRQSPRARAGRVKRRGAGEGGLGHDDS